MTTQRRIDGFQLTDVVLLQVILRQLEAEAMMRYISNPDNVEIIAALIMQAKDDMEDLEGKGICPRRWHHEPDCRCVPDEFRIPGKGSLKSRSGIRPDDILSEMERLLEQVHNLFRRIYESSRPQE